MIPILFGSTATTFTSQGLGALTGTISCTVTEERNGIYELEMTYPLTGEHYGDLVAGNIILAIPSPYRDGQPFRIYKVTKPLGESVTVYANHISYDLNKIPVKPFSATSAADAMSSIKSNCVISNNFEFTTDKPTAANMKIETPTAARSCLGGIDGSILDTYGGEYEWDKFTVYLKASRGTDSGVVIRYGKNLTGLTQEGDTSSLVTGIMPYWYNEGTLVNSSPLIIYAEGATGQTAIPVDFTESFDDQPTAAQLKSAAESYIKSNNIGVPDVSLTTEFLNLSQMSGYEDIELLEKCDLCDTVTVEYEQAGINAKAKIVSITTDVLLERYDQIEIGSIRANIAQTIADQQKQIDDTAVTPSMLTKYIDNATSWITGGRGGYVVFHKNADGQPDEILIMNTPDISTATQVWRWNSGGLGYSSNGYAGPYKTAITQDGKIVADFISTGTMLANIIKGGTLTLGGNGNGNGVCRVLDANGAEIVTLNSNGMLMKRGTINIDATSMSQDAFSMQIDSEYESANQHARVRLGIRGLEIRNGGTLGLTQVSIDGHSMAVQRLYGTIDSPTGTNTVAYMNILSDGSGNFYLKGSARIEGNLVVTGTKNRVVDTDTYGKRLMNAYETATPYFGDIGTATIGADGTSEVTIDPIFAETVSLADYVVFLQAEGAGEAYIGEKREDAFCISGTPGLTVAYEIKARQKGYENIRLEEHHATVLPDRS